MKKTLFNGKTGFSRAIVSFKLNLEKNAAHDEVYDRTYYEQYTDKMKISAKGIAEYIVEHEKPRSCIDVGCGSGEVLKALAGLGVSVQGYDNSEAALAMCREQGLTVEKLDLEDGPVPRNFADVVVSTEVAEHIPEKLADAYVLFLTRSAPIVYMTGATPGQGGTDHVNEQPNEYWISKFADHGMTYDTEAVHRTRKIWSANGVDGHRAKNLMIFRARAA